MCNTKRTKISSTGNGDRNLSQRDDKQNRGTIPMPTFAGRPSTMSSLTPVDFFTEYSQFKKRISLENKKPRERTSFFEEDRSTS